MAPSVDIGPVAGAAVAGGAVVALRVFAEPADECGSVVAVWMVHALAVASDMIVRAATAGMHDARLPARASTTRATGTRTPGTREIGTRTPGTREIGTRTPGTREIGTRDRGTRGSSTRDTLARFAGSFDSFPKTCKTASSRLDAQLDVPARTFPTR